MILFTQYTARPLRGNDSPSDVKALLLLLLLFHPRADSLARGVKIHWAKCCLVARPALFSHTSQWRSSYTHWCALFFIFFSWILFLLPWLDSYWTSQLLPSSFSPTTSTKWDWGLKARVTWTWARKNALCTCVLCCPPIDLALYGLLISFEAWEIFKMKIDFNRITIPIRRQGTWSQQSGNWMRYVKLIRRWNKFKRGKFEF